ncbi:MAG TPA: flavin reductase family protein [Candidatus Dormibacteraeota bacterium]|nr:flavin reductase family protein [Candidatus Dormibacteraeota bacterium]
MADSTSPPHAALAALTTGIYVLTTRDGAVRHGMSSSWVTQVSGTPPLLVAAVDVGHASHAMIEGSGRFALNVVGGAARHLEDYFYSPASHRADNLATVACDESPAGLPYLRDALASLECRVVDRHRAGDHTLFVAEITDAVVRGADRPLTSLDLEYVYVGTVIRR